MSASENPLLVVLGPTASGKTTLAVQIATQKNGEIISADSRQVYRGMNIGTGKDLEAYVWQGKTVPYHLIDIADAGERYHLFAFQQDFRTALSDIRNRGKQPLLCGGTGLYIDAVLNSFAYTEIPVDRKLREKLEEDTHETLRDKFRAMRGTYHALADLSTKKRTIRAIEIAAYLQKNKVKTAEAKPPAIVFGLTLPPEERRARISRRLRERLDAGLLDEVKLLVKTGLGFDDLHYYGLEYRFAARFLQGEISYDEFVFRLETAIHQFARRQMTYFRKMEKDGLRINWIDALLPTEAQLAQVNRILGEINRATSG